MTEQRKSKLRDQIRRSRARLMVKDPDVAMVLMYLSFISTKNVHRISTNGKAILFDPDWFQKLDSEETDYILSHEVIHIVLEDTGRPAFFSGDRYHHACDIIACSIMRERGWYCNRLQHIGELPHRTYFPGHEGNELEPLEAYREVPFDPSNLPPAKRRKFQIDSDGFWGKKNLPDDGILILYPGYDDMVSAPTEYTADSNDTGRKSLCMTSVSSFDEALDASIDRLLSLIEAMDSEDTQQVELLDRIRKGVGSSKLEWRRLLTSFLQEEINDYSFQPPDRRFSESDFFLPDFNQAEQSVKDILFMIDTSGSIDDEVISDVYGEICAAIEQFGGSLQGKLAFFDAQVFAPAPFSSIHQLLKIRPKGGGYTDFSCVFRWIKRNCPSFPTCLVIFTDGMGEYPPETDAMGMPVLWILYGNAPFPGWGKTARINN